MKKFEDYNFVVIDTRKRTRRDKTSPEKLTELFDQLDENSKALALERAKVMAEENKNKPYS